MCVYKIFVGDLQDWAKCIWTVWQNLLQDYKIRIILKNPYFVHIICEVTVSLCKNYNEKREENGLEITIYGLILRQMKNDLLNDFILFFLLASDRVACIQNKSFEVKKQELQYFDIFSLNKNLRCPEIIMYLKMKRKYWNC